MKSCIIVPARYASTRYPGKPLVKLRGKDGEKTLIQRSWERACEVKSAEDVFVATDDSRIFEHLLEIGAQVIMTSNECRNGTERCAEAARNLDYEWIINLQGDAPLTPPWFIESLLENSGDSEVVTPVLPLDTNLLDRLREDRKNGLVGATTAIFDHEYNALYFSKEVLPYGNAQGLSHFHHVGVYAYSNEALERYLNWPETPLERAEGLEQLRFIYYGESVKCVEVEARGRVFWELNNPVDVARIEKELL